MVPQQTNYPAAVQADLDRLIADTTQRQLEIKHRIAQQNWDIEAIIVEITQAAADLLAVAETTEQMDSTAQLGLAEQLMNAADNISAVLAIQSGQAAPHEPGFLRADEDGVTVTTNLLRLSALGVAGAAIRRATELGDTSTDRYPILTEYITASLGSDES